KEKVGQLFMPAAFINDSEEEIQRLEVLIREHCIGGLCFFHSRASAATNFEGRKKIVRNEQSVESLKNLIKRYQKVAKYPLLISIDAEWGLAMRIENTPQYPYAITLGAIEEQLDLVYEVGKNIAYDCKQVGVHWNLSPVVDINTNPFNPVIGYRSFGGDKEQVACKAAAFVRGTHSEGILTSIKHFPGHGDTATDSHLGLPIINKTKKALLTHELYPFQQLIATGIDAVMVGHLSVPSLTDGKSIPATISKDIIQGILRNQMGFEGVVISDALNMRSVSKLYPKKGELEWLAFDAGNDVLCFSEHLEEGIASILKNASKNQLGESFERLWKLKEKGINVTKEITGKLIHPEPLNRKLAQESLTLFKGSENILSSYRNTDMTGVVFGKSEQCTFFNSISKAIPLRSYVLNATFSKSSTKKERVLLALFPPQIKPTNNFGLEPTELQRINALIRRTEVVVYLFGNPYALQHIDIENAKAVVLVYQDFEVFQENAAKHFLGKVPAKGILPVSINKS
ncbi:MAG: glycoside hydrolase family 3 protein, partial [Bacteroidota bacterium]